MLNSRLVEDVADCGKAKGLVERFGTELGVENHRRGAGLFHHAPHERSAQPQPAIGPQNGNALDLDFPSFEDTCPRRADTERIDGDKVMPANIVQPVEFLFPGNALFIAKHDATNVIGKLPVFQRDDL